MVWWSLSIAMAGTPTCAEVLSRIDTNLTFDTRVSTATMAVNNGRRTVSYQMRTFGSGADRSAVEYLAPERDAGTRLLRLGEDVWWYQPALERTQRIAGHLMREGVLGSDVSYDDLTRNEALLSRYDGTVSGPEPCPAGGQCLVLHLTARTPDVTYASRTAWVDQETWLPVHQELRAASGELLKTWDMSAPHAYGARWFPGVMVVRDVVAGTGSTTVTFDSVSFGEAVSPETFSPRWLER